MPLTRTCLSILLIWFCVGKLPAQAQFIYTTNSGTVAITGYSGTNEAVTIPPTINGLPVTTIGDSAFAYNYTLTNVMISANVTDIGYQAFANCDYLTAITVDSENLFYSSIGGVLFNSNQTTLIQFPSGGCGPYDVPETVASIGDFAFSSCSALANIILPGTIQNIGADAFAGSGLSNVLIPASVTNIGTAAFFFCQGLMNISVDSQNAFYSSTNGVLFDKNQTALIEYPAGANGYYVLPASVASIADYAFDHCEGVSGVSFPNGLTNIGQEAFGNDLLCGVVLPASVVGIEDFAFFDNPFLTNVTIAINVARIGNGAFCRCASLSAITVDSQNPFYSSVSGVLFDKNQTTLIQCPGRLNGTYTIPASVTDIGTNSFAGCNISEVIIPASVTNIADQSFYGCFILTDVNFLGNSPTAGVDVFYADNNASVYYLPGTLEWGLAFAGRPTTFWNLANPLILASGPGFGTQTNGFGFSISWATNLSIIVDACTNLAKPNWQPLQTNTLSNGVSYFNDPQWRAYPGRFYRVRSP